MSRAVTVSSKFQIVIPKEVREAHDIKPGDQLAFVDYKGVMTLVPALTFQQLRGILKGTDGPPFEREKHDRNIEF
jgi:AbrB family looped-hinge helix DNA binding protein